MEGAPRMGPPGAAACYTLNPVTASEALIAAHIDKLLATLPAEIGKTRVDVRARGVTELVRDVAARSAKIRGMDPSIARRVIAEMAAQLDAEAKGDAAGAAAAAMQAGGDDDYGGDAEFGAAGLGGDDANYAYEMGDAGVAPGTQRRRARVLRGDAIKDAVDCVALGDVTVRGTAHTLLEEAGACCDVCRCAGAGALTIAYPLGGSGYRLCGACDRHKHLHERAAHRFTLVQHGDAVTHGPVLVQLRPDEFRRLVLVAPLGDASAGAARTATETEAAQRKLPSELEVIGALWR